jgi:hypothetical protein
MNRVALAKPLVIASLVSVLAALTCYAGQPVSPFTSPASGPEAAPNPAYITIGRSGSNAIRLDWDHPDASLTSYEVWRSELPYFSPGNDPSVRIGSYAFSPGIYGEYAPFNYTDNGTCGYFTAAGQQLPCLAQNPPVIVVGDAAHQYYWLVRAGNGEYADSNSVGEFDFALVAGY